jgi:hypothetical protein
MNRQPEESTRAAQGPEPDQQMPPQQPDQISLLRRGWARWVWLTGPKAERFSSDLAAQESLRHSRLISALLLILVAVLGFFVPSGLGGYSLVWVQILTMASCGVLVAVLNRWGQVTLSALVMTLLVDVALLQFLLSLPRLNTTNLADLDLFTIAVLIGGILLPRWLIVSTSALQIALIILVFYLKLHDPVLDAEIGKYEAGLGYAALTDPILLQICGASIAWLYAWSVQRALLRANRAEELADARARISAQARQIAEQNQRLAQGIALLQEAQARVANGEYSARISLQKNELLPVAVSFNIMAERLSRNEQTQQAYRRLEHGVGQVLEAFMTLGKEMTPLKFTPTGTLVDRVFPYLARVRILRLALNQSRPLAEEVALTLHRQQKQLAQIEANLTHILLLTRELAGTASWADAPHASTPLHRLEGSRSAEQFPALPRLRTLLERQTTLLEQTQQSSIQVRELSVYGFQQARTLSSSLKEAS